MAEEETAQEETRGGYRSGYVALFEIEDPASVLIVAVRHQLEDDYH